MSEPALDPLQRPSGYARSALIIVESPNSVRRRIHRLVKDAIDVGVGSVLALLAIPAILVLATVLAVRLRQWPFFWHRRIGRKGRIITFPKLRTLPKSTPRYALKNGGEVIPADRFCGMLRRRHLDELPQLLMVPVLRMSLVGPRPKMPDRFEPTDPGYRNARLLVRQGCTGLWQIGHESHHLVHERPDYDFCYLQYGSLRMDLWILLRTGLLLIGGRTVRLSDVPRWALGRGWVTDEQIRAAGGAKFLIDRARVGR